MKINRIMIAAPKSGSGKTVITCALLQALKDSGWRTVSFKCGPDYIDPMFHEKVIGVPAENLDTFFTGEEQTRELFLKSAEGKDLAVMEGVMGLYDGLGGVREEGSSYHLARVTRTPIILAVDAKGMGRSLISLIAGFLAYDKERLIRGVLLNRISKGYYEILKPLIEKELEIPVAGYLPEQEELCIESRHLGLVMPGELEDIRHRMRTASIKFSKTVSLEKIVGIAKEAQELNFPGETASGKWKMGKADYVAEDAGAASRIIRRSGGSKVKEADRPVIAVARDEAFCFYYADNIRMLEESGAEIRSFSPLRDENLPEGCCGLLIGGGYPELYAEKLSRNQKMLAAVRDAAAGGMPVVAECGGFMYLHSSITDKEGICHNMAGVIPAACFYAGKLVRFGYVEIQEKQSFFLPRGEKIRGHEFHYYDSTDNGNGAIAIKPVTGKDYSCMIEDETHWMGFPHLYYPSNPMFARSFVAKTLKYKNSLVTNSCKQELE
ncbi:MAG: cobyrinate a,c-diamide synthase [Lachnospiraceae bacterium]|nr:cobyrinate a,c-diamide synthase [Butyrivibrio sp.]MCM1344647.1 cobyrinate a,c-diamide synthase [Muribaculaceae bacterium]MCM1411209.1 cobyrinate a,c-diamide synthase [Lachnospiraceae bacterium]